MKYIVTEIECGLSETSIEIESLVEAKEEFVRRLIKTIPSININEMCKALQEKYFNFGIYSIEIKEEIDKN